MADDEKNTCLERAIQNVVSKAASALEVERKGETNHPFWKALLSENGSNAICER